MPMISAVCAAALGIVLGIVQVATMTASISAGDTPESLTAREPASAAMSTSRASSGAIRRLWMPTRSRIHWSLVSMRWASSSLVTIRSGWWLPRPSRRAPGTGGASRSCVTGALRSARPPRPGPLGS